MNKQFRKITLYPGNKTEIDEHITLERVSRWINIHTDYHITKRHPLYDYSTDCYGIGVYNDGCNKHDLTVNYFRYNGRKYAIDGFICFNSCWGTPGLEGYIEGSEHKYLAAYEGDNYYNPLLLEMDEYCERVRLYREVKHILPVEDFEVE